MGEHASHFHHGIWPHLTLSSSQSQKLARLGSLHRALRPARGTLPGPLLGAAVLPLNGAPMGLPPAGAAGAAAPGPAPPAVAATAIASTAQQAAGPGGGVGVGVGAEGWGGFGGGGGEAGGLFLGSKGNHRPKKQEVWA